MFQLVLRPRSAFPAAALAMLLSAPDVTAQHWRPPCSPARLQAVRNLNPRVIPPHSKPFGLSYADWGAQWWKWALAIPASINPILDPTGAFGGVNQHGPVFFLAGTAGAYPTTRSITVPYGKFIFFPLINFISDWPCPGPDFCAGIPLEKCLQDIAAFYMDHVTELECTVDGVPLRALHRYRATSGLFTFTGDPSMTVFDSCITGSPQPAISDGFWLMLTPLSPGGHTINFRAKIVVPGPDGFEFETGVNYTIVVLGC